MEPTTPVTFTLAAHEWNVVFGLLRKGPHDMVDAIWQSLQKQARDAEARVVAEAPATE